MKKRGQRGIKTVQYMQTSTKYIFFKNDFTPSCSDSSEHLESHDDILFHLQLRDKSVGGKMLHSPCISEG